jgi:hypothetical protein
MKPRHAAALALVGWYLMTPPLAKDAIHPDKSVPLKNWNRFQSFDSAKECEQRLMGFVKNYFVAKGPDFYWEPLADGECIASDDPRLKEK